MFVGRSARILIKRSPNEAIGSIHEMAERVVPDVAAALHDVGLYTGLYV